MKLLRRLIYFLRYRRNASDLAEEIEFHRKLKQEQFEQSGLTPADAAHASRRALGNASIAREDARNVWIWPAFDQLLRDVHVGARMLLKAPLFTVFSALILSIGIGANVTVFTYLNALFFKPHDVPQPERLVRIYGEGEGPNGGISYSSYERYRDGNESFASIGMYDGNSPTPIRIQGPRALPVDVTQPMTLTASLFNAIGLPPLMGRNIEPDDESQGAANVVMLNGAAWQKYFASDPGAIGRTLFINNTPCTIIGVVSPSFEDVFKMIPTSTGATVILPDRPGSGRGRAGASLLGRLKAGVARTAAEADLSRIASQLSQENNFHISVTVEPSNQPPAGMRTALASLTALFMVGVFVVLLIACDDIAIMLSARIAARQREMGIRLALGARRGHLVRQLVAENVMLAGLGGAGAMIFALFSARALEQLPLQVPIPDSFRLTLDWRVLAFTTVISLATTLFFGLRPALQCVRKDVVVSLNPGSSAASPGHARVRSNLIITQVAVCTALLITAAVLVRSTSANLTVDRGFRPDHVLLSSINFVGTGYAADAQRAFHERLLTRLRETPGVVSAAIVDSLPIALPGGNFFRFGGALGRYVVRSESGNESIPVATNIVSPGHFAVLRVPLIEGRDFSDNDNKGSAKVGILNQSLARRMWPNESPVGKSLRGEDGLIEVIGVAGNVQYEAEQQVAPLLYRPLAQSSGRTVPNTLMVRTAAEPMLAAPLVQARIGEIDANLLAFEMHTLEDRIGRTLLPYQILTYITGIPGAFALLLGVIGTYGTMALVVAQRRREIGVRIALGALPSRAVSVVIREGMKWTSLGLCLGLIVAVLIAFWLSRYFYGLNFFDPVAFVAMMLLVVATAGAAFYIPARRASRLDPMKVLREG
jgi:putative ABC transport system permease protein